MDTVEIAILAVAVVLLAMSVWTWVTVHRAASLLANYLEAKLDAGEWPPPPEVLVRRHAGPEAGRDASWSVDR